MKNKNKNRDKFAYWSKKNSKRNNILALGMFFTFAIFFIWVILFSYAQAALQVGSYFFKWGGRSLSTGSAVSIEKGQDTREKYYYRLLDGLPAEKNNISLVPYAVMVENLPTVRPQSGLSQASVVYEALVEGGATRFMAVFDPTEKIPEIMPIRSARPYYLEWVSEYGALYAHAGGSPKALTVIRENSDINNLEALSIDGKYFWRDTSKYAPHNLVTNSEKMNYALRDKELSDKKNDFRGWLFKKEAEKGERGEDGKKVSFNFSYGLSYKVGYLYNRQDNQYYRFNAGKPHLDKNTGQQITVKNVVVQLVEEPILRGGKGRLDIYVGGTGKAWIFLDGKVIEGSWKKGSRTDRTLFYDSSGREIKFNRGNIWIHVLPKSRNVLYQ